MKRLSMLHRGHAGKYGFKAANLGVLSNDFSELNVPYGVVIEENEIDDLEPVLRLLDDDFVIVRSSFVGEDSAVDSMAGKFESFVVENDIEFVKEGLKKVFASGPEHIKKNAIIQRYIKGKLSGEFFTCHPDNKNAGFTGSVAVGNGGTVNGRICTTSEYHFPQKLIDIKDKLVLHFGSHLDIEWVTDHEGKLWVVQIRPITRVARQKEEILHGLGILNEFAVGTAIVLDKPGDLRFMEGIVNRNIIIVAPHTNREWESIMGIAGGLVTDHGTNTCHASIYCREINLPAVIGTIDATKRIATGDRLYLDTLTNPGFGKVYKEVYEWENAKQK